MSKLLLIDFLFRCGNCFDCPSCGHTLSTRATTVAVPNPDDPGKPNPKKMYYLACGFCRWTTRDVGIPDQSVGERSQLFYRSGIANSGGDLAYENFQSS